MQTQSAGEWPWYMTIAALRQFMEAVGYRGAPEDSNPDFSAAEQELGALTLQARATGNESRSGALEYRTGRVTVGPRKIKTRMEFFVMPVPRIEGNKPQLVNVRLKGHNRGQGGR